MTILRLRIKTPHNEVGAQRAISDHEFHHVKDRDGLVLAVVTDILRDTFGRLYSLEGRRPVREDWARIDAEYTAAIGEDPTRATHIRFPATIFDKEAQPCTRYAHCLEHLMREAAKSVLPNEKAPAQ